MHGSNITDHLVDEGAVVDSSEGTLPEVLETQNRRATRLFAKNSAVNVLRLGLTSVVAILLPAYLTHHLPVATYGAWVLILQLSAYVSYLDFGVQTAVSKYIAEYDARGDEPGCGRCASAGLRILLGAGALGILLTLGLAWRVPELFHTMPRALQGDVRISILFVGISLSISLAASVFSAIFLGLQQYQIPMLATVLTRLLYGGVVCVAVAMHTSLAAMGAAVAAANLAGALLTIILWRRLASRISLSLWVVDQQMLRQMLAYCGVLTIWSVCMLFISGIDLTIVGHYDLGQVAFYAVASAPTNLMLTIIGAVMGPLLPATSALSTARTPRQMGEILATSTRYSTLLLLLAGLPLLVGAFLILKVWVGPVYAVRSVGYLRVLLLATMLRNLLSPYSTMVIALSRQRMATAAAVTEGAVNLICSIVLAIYFGAIGVALGTLIGSVAGVAMHFGLSMHNTQVNFEMPRRRLLLKGILRPGVVALPSLLLGTFWWRASAPAFPPVVWALWAAATLLLTWFAGISETERQSVLRFANRRAAAV